MDHVDGRIIFWIVRNCRTWCIWLTLATTAISARPTHPASPGMVQPSSTASDTARLNRLLIQAGDLINSVPDSAVLVYRHIMKQVEQLSHAVPEVDRKPPANYIL